MTNREDPDEMPHNAAFHQGLHCLLRQNQKTYIFYGNYNLWSLNDTVDHPDYV